MDVKTVAELLVYVVMTMLAADRAWAFFGGKKRHNGNSSHGKINSMQHELDEMRRVKIEQKLDEMLAQSKANHVAISVLNRECHVSHAEIVEKIRGICIHRPKDI